MIHRSFIVPANAREAKFTAPVAKFLGVIPGPGGALPGSFVICALCDQPVEALRPSGLVLPSGQTAPAPLRAGEPEWIVQVCFEGDERPAPSAGHPDVAWPTTAMYLGSILTGMGPAAVYVRRG